MESNKAIILSIFEGLVSGNHRALLERVAQDAEWTVTGTCPVSGTYRGRQAFYEQVLSPVTSRLTGRVKPTVVRCLGEGDWVVLEWRGEATSSQGFAYNNAYCWVMRIEAGEIRQGFIYSDTELVTRLWEGS